MAYLSDEEIDRRLGINNTPKLAQINQAKKYSYMPAQGTAPIDNNAPDFMPGAQRGLQNLQASFYGAGALAGKGIQALGAETAGKKLWNVGVEGYRRNIEEAAQYPQKHSFRDVYTGKAGIGGTIDYIQTKAGEIVPSMVEAAAGAAIGSFIAPGPGTAVGGLAGRTLLKKGIDQAVKKAMKEGIKNVSEAELRKQVTKQALKKLGGKVGIGAAVMPMESGSTYANLLEEHNVDAPGIALFAGALKTSLEFFGGNSKLVDTFVDAMAKGSKGIVKRSVKEILTNIPQEALQEGGQELIDIFTTVANTDEKLLTVENLESLVESMFVGSIGGGFGAVATTMLGGKETVAEKKERQIDQQVQNIISGGNENIQAANEKLTTDLTDINTLLKDPDVLEATAVEQDISVEDLTVNLNTEVTEITELQNRLQKETGTNVDTQIDTEGVNVDPSEAQKEAGNYKKAAVKIDNLEIKIENPAGSVRSGKDKDGNEWSSQMNGHYGYFARTEGKDGDQVDTIIKPGTTSSPLVYVIDQVDPKTGKFDEHKVIMGTNSAQEAKDLYMANYEKDWKGFGAIKEMEQTDFKEWLKDGKRTKQPIALSTKEDLSWKQQIKAQQFDKLWNDYARNDITLEQVKNRLKSQFNLTKDEITAQISERKNIGKERQRRKEQQVEIDRLWTEYNTPDRSIEARKDIQKDLDALYWPAEQEADELHNRKIRQLLELAETPEEKDIAHTAIRNFYARGRQVKTPIDETTSEPILIDPPQRTIIGEQKYNFLDRATERLGGKVEPTIIYDKDKYAREVIDAEKDRARILKGESVTDETRPFTNEQQVDEDLIADGDQITITQQNPQIKTETFKKWFDKSKVVDKNGEPLVVYHGTNFKGDIAEFEGGGGEYGDGVYFSPVRKIAKDFGNSVYEVYLSIKNPLTDSPLTQKETDHINANSDIELRGFKDFKAGESALDQISNGMNLAQIAKQAGYDGLLLHNEKEYIAFSKTQIKSATGNKGTFNPKDSNINFQVYENQAPGQGIQLAEIQKMYPKQDVFISENKEISVRFKNGQGITIDNIQNAGKDFIELAVKTGQMSTEGKILGVTLDNKILLDSNFADNKTMWHENKHVLDNLGMITKADDSLLNKEFNRLHKADKLQFALSKHEDSKQRMVENRANMFAQIMVDREAYRNKPLDKIIQRVLDFFQQLLGMGQQTVAGLAREVESGKIYNRTINGKTVQTTVPQLESMAAKWYSQMEQSLDAKLPGKGTPEQLKQMVDGWAKKGDFKADELSWSGLSDWIGEQKGKITKTEVMKYLAENRLGVQEVIKGGLGFEGRSARMDELITRENAGMLTANEDVELDRLEQEVNSGSEDADDTKFSRYQESGGENYREIFLTAPKAKGYNWEDGHREYSDVENPVVRIRTNERTDSDENRTLFIEEIQGPQKKEAEKMPKWMQEGKNQILLGMKYMVRYAAENGFDKIAWTTGEMQAARYDLSKQVDRIEYKKIKSSTMFASSYDLSPAKETIIGNYEISVFDKNDTEIYGANNASAKDLEDVVGKEIVQKMEVGEGKKNKQGDQILSGLDLKVGGEKLINLYDKMIPAIVNKFFGKKAWGNARVGKVEIGTGEYSVSKSYGTDGKTWYRIVDDGGNTVETFWEKSEADKQASIQNKKEGRGKTETWSLPITPQMKSKALREGMPMFQNIPIDENNLPEQVKTLLNSPQWKKIKSAGQLYRNKEFFDKTGFWIAKDGKWRYEIDDSKIKYSEFKIGLDMSFNDSFTKKLSEIISYDELYKIVPKLKNLKVKFDKDAVSSYYSSKENMIVLNTPEKQALFHEIQHAVNKELGGPRGTSMEQSRIDGELQEITKRFKEIAERSEHPETREKAKEILKEGLHDESDIDWFWSQIVPFIKNFESANLANSIAFPISVAAKRTYMTNLGEMEARLIEARLNMSVEERKAIPPWNTLDRMLRGEGLLSQQEHVTGTGVGQAFFQVREPLPEQKISDQRYTQIVNQKKNLLKKYGQSLRIKSSSIKLMLERSLTPISTRLKIIGLDDLSETIRQLDFRTAMTITAALKVAHPMMKRMKRKDVSKADRITWDWARKNSDLGKITQIARKYGFEEDYNKLREILDKIRQDAIDVGLTVGYIEDYWPRVLKDQEGFLQATQGISRRADFTEAIKKKAKSLGLTVAQMDDKYPDLKADIISNLILGRPEGMGGPSNTQARVFEEIPDEYAEFYEDSDSALMGYIYSMTKKIEARKFFGKVPQRIATIKRKRNSAQTELLKLEQLAALGASEAMTEDQQNLVSAQQERIDLLKDNVKDYEGKLDDYKQDNRDYTENIGVYINDLMLAGKLNKKDEKAVKDILTARFHERGTTGPVHWYKNLAYIDVMGNPMAAMTQIGDMAWAMYVGEIWNPLRLPSNIKNLTKALFKKSNITKEDLGIERMAQEFADFDSLSRAVSKVFKGVGLERIDSIGKEFLINNAFDAYKRQASTEEGRAKLLKKIRPTFGNASNKVINELLALDKNSTAEPSENIKMLLYSRLLDFQPVALSEMPEYYLKGGNWRILYMLKTFGLKQLDVFRNEVWQALRHGDAQQKLKAIGNMTALMGVLALANAGADEVKDFMVGKETSFSDEVIENFLTMGGANRHVRMQARREGIGTAIGQMILPPFRFVNSISKDILDLSMFDLEKSRTLESVPFIGKLAYWNVGRGKEYRPSIEEQDFSKAGKKFRKFKKDFEESNDKRLFLQANVEDFKQLKIYENFQKSIRKITTRINKLKKLPQNTNVLKLIGQLEATQEQFRQRYFEISAK